MRTTDHVQFRRAETGVALLIAIFALLLISGVAISLIVMSGTESAIDANYRGSTQVFYASYSGLEEGRGRLRFGDPNTLDAIVGINRGTTEVPVDRVRYILNPAPGEVVNPTNLAPDNPYRDLEYQTEFGTPVNNRVVCPSANCVNSTSGGVIAGVPGTVFKWVRITPKTERAAGLDVDGDGDGPLFNNTRPIFYDGQNQILGPACPPCGPPPTDPTTGALYGQVMRVTALAVVPGGNRRLLQYDVARVFLNLSFGSPLTLDGAGGTYTGGTSNNFLINGNDNPAGCGGTGPPQACKPGIGTVTTPDQTTITTTLSGPPYKTNNFTGCGGPPSVGNIGAPAGGGTGSLPPNEQTPASLAQLAQQIQKVATQTLPPGALNYGTLANPTITYVTGDLSIMPPTPAGGGFGILVVTGNFTITGNFIWNGVILVVGTGNATLSGGTQINGALLVANTLGGVPTVTVSGGGPFGKGVLYSSGCVKNAQSGVPYNVLSFREISQ